MGIGREPHRTPGRPQRQAQGERRRRGRSARSEQAARADRDRPRSGHPAGGLRAGGLRSRRRPPTVHVARVPFVARPPHRSRGLDPASATYPISILGERYLGVDVVGDAGEDEAGQLFAEDPWRATAADAAAVALLAPVMEEEVDRLGLRHLLEDVELPLSSVLARMEARGVRLDVEYLQEMGAEAREQMAELTKEIYRLAGREFNLNSPPQLREVLYDELGLQPGKRTTKGALSTDASVLEKLRDDHKIVDALLSWRELDKLNSTYLEALPRMVEQRDGRVHTTFNQAAAATGRLSSSNPNLQHIPVRSELGRQIRRAFVPGTKDQLLLVADYSQIELRILAHLTGDAGLRDAFAGGQDIHAATAARVFGLPPAHVDPESRRRAKAV